MNVDDIHMSELSISEEEETTDIYVSLMSMMRIQYDSVTAMELDEELNESIGVEDCDTPSEIEEEGNEEESYQTTLGDLIEGIEIKREKDAEKKTVYRDYSDLQIEGFLDLLNNGTILKLLEIPELA